MGVKESGCLGLLRYCSRGLSTIVATVILFGVVGILGFTATYWLREAVSHYTKFERLQIQSATCTKHSENGGAYWVIELQLKNPGTVTVTFRSLALNSVEVQFYGVDGNVEYGASTSMSSDETLDVGESKTYRIYVDDHYPSPEAPYTSGTTIVLRLHSAGGLDYFRSIELV